MTDILPECHKRKHLVRHHECGPNGNIKLQLLMDCLQDIAAEHAEMLGCGAFIISFDDIKNISLSFQIWLIVTAIYSAIFLPFIAYYCYKMVYLLKHYEDFYSYEVILDNVSTSYAYKGAVYYTVTVCDEGISRQVSTNPYFSSSIFAKFALEDYNNKKVIGLYDSEREKFYIVKKIG